ncbi:MAG: endonuclease/exonuclease/phosphatase family protein [Verrucomicrobiota bacterium]
MKAFPVFLAAVSVALTSLSFGETQTLTTWNLEWFPGRDPAPDFAHEAIQISLVHEELEKLSPDILLLQEIRDQENAELAVRILPGMKVQVVSQFSSQFGNGQQLVIASKEDPVETGSVSFPRYRGDPPRGFVFARYQFGDGQLLIYNVHLKSNNGGIPENIPKRETAIRRLLAHHAKMKQRAETEGAGDLSVVLGGDYNSDPSDPRFASEKTTKILTDAGFRWALEELSLKDRVTWPSNGTYPDACLDHFFYVPSRGITFLETEVHPGTERASDHRAVSMQLRY